MSLAINKTGWKKVKLGDVVIKREENDRESASRRFDRFLKVEHMDAGSLHIRRWGSQKLGDQINPTFYKIFRKGQLLFPTRNPHLRRTSLAFFDGICGEKTLTLEPIEEYVLADFIPFLFHSEEFYIHTTSSIIGSTNPHCRWRDIASYEFLLPPKDQQEEIAKLLWSIDKVVLQEKILEGQLEVLRDINREQLFTIGMETYNNGFDEDLKVSRCGLIRTDIKVVKFFENVEIKSGQVDPTDSAYSSLFQIGSERIEPNTGRVTEFKTAKELNITSGNYLFTERDIIYSKIRPYFKKVANPNITGLCSADIYPLRSKDEGVLSKDYLFYYLLTEKFTRKLLRFQNRTGMPKVNRDELGSMYIPLPSIDEQNEIVGKLKDIDEVLFVHRHKYKQSQLLQKTLINQVF